VGPLLISPGSRPFVTAAEGYTSAEAGDMPHGLRQAR
jgi:hypothetical protein